MIDNEKIILPAVYLGNISYYTLMLNNPRYILDIHEHYIKQTYRSRCCIYGANGALNLIIPLKKYHNNTPVKDILISYDSDWQQLHWRSIQSAYRSSPYFEYYEEDFLPFYTEHQPAGLIDYNLQIQEMVLELLEMDVEMEKSVHYQQEATPSLNFLKYFTPKRKKVYNFPPYSQVFANKYGFIENLSIMDLLFNLGPEAKRYLKSCSLPEL